jgi:hypothetical protein
VPAPDDETDVGVGEEVSTHPARLRRAYTDAVASLGEDEELVALYCELGAGETTI